MKLKLHQILIDIETEYIKSKNPLTYGQKSKNIDSQPTMTANSTRPSLIYNNVNSTKTLQSEK